MEDMKATIRDWFRKRRDTKTLEENEKRTRDYLEEISVECIHTMVNTYNESVLWIESNPLGLTREQVVHAIGEEKLKEMVKLGTLLKELVNMVMPDTFDDPDPYKK